MSEIKASEAARKLADGVIDLEEIQGTGKDGLITKGDVEKALALRAETDAETDAEAEDAEAEDTVVISLARDAPFTAVDLPGSDPSVVLRAGESARVGASVVEATEKAFRTGALPERLAKYLSVEE